MSQTQQQQRMPQRPLTPQQAQQWLAAEAAKHNLSVEQFQLILRAQAERQAQQQKSGQQTHTQQQQQQQQQQLQQHMQQQQHQQQPPVNPGAPNPQAIALAKWLRSQELKPRTCILNGQRKDMFKVKRALRALQSPAYATASAKKPSLLLPVTDRETAENVFKLLPLSLLALRVSKVDPHEGHNHAPPKKTKRTKGLWTVTIEQQQEVRDDLHFVWIYEGPQLKQKLYAAGALLIIMAIVMFPLWPMKMRLGVWYLSMGMLGLIGLFFAMSIFRLILFCVTMFAVPPGIWLYPNLFEDVGFFDSFRPLWGWQEDKKSKKKKSKTGDAAGSDKKSSSHQATASGLSSATPPMQRRDIHPRVEEVFDED
ncbi:MAG: Translocation protein S62 [Trichoglossum hirsutum]|nr:MAG: Translocation protein S62 [Trichoglossum hirsutum]